MPTHPPVTQVLRLIGKKDLHRCRSDRPDLLSVWGLCTVFAAGLSFHAVA